MPLNEWDPKYWFLSPTEEDTLDKRQQGWTSYNNRARTGYPTWKIHRGFGLDRAYTNGNSVTALIDGRSYMTDLLAQMQPLVANDLVLIVGWEFWRNRNLGPQVLPPPPTLGGELHRLAQSQAAVRLIAYANLAAGKPAPNPWFNRNKEVVDALNGVVAQTAALDGAPFAMSHHQKAVFLGRAAFSDSRAYVGGIDLAIDRWDDPAHSLPAKENHFFGWHDIQVVVRGKAITQIWANFAERWESLGLPACPVPSWALSAPPASGPPPAAPPLGTQSVQMLRTVAPASARKRLTRFLPNGERTVRAALKKAILLAEHYIYIEEQFLWDCELATHIHRAMSTNHQLHLIVVLAASTEFPGAAAAHHYHLRSRFFMTVLGVPTPDQIAFGLGTRVHVYGLYQLVPHGGHSIYVHSKLLIIDDRYVAIGSANVNERSLSIETELTLAIVDKTTVAGSLGGAPATVCAFAKNLRETLWLEHLGVPAPLPPDPLAALQQQFPPYRAAGAWPATKGQAQGMQVHHLRCYVNDAGKEILTPATRRIFDRGMRHVL